MRKKYQNINVTKIIIIKINVNITYKESNAIINNKSIKVFLWKKFTSFFNNFFSKWALLKSWRMLLLFKANQSNNSFVLNNCIYVSV